MTKDQAIIFVICYTIAFILIFKIYNYIKLKKKMILIKTKVTDKTYRTGYEKNTYIYYYEYMYKNEVFTSSDSTRYKLFFFNPSIKDELDIYINPHDPNKVITPLKIKLAKINIYIIIILLILPFIFII